MYLTGRVVYHLQGSQTTRLVSFQRLNVHSSLLTIDYTCGTIWKGRNNNESQACRHVLKNDYRKDIDTYEESHPIIGVGLVKPKRDIFNPDITHVLVIATTLHINVVAISFKRSPSGATQLTFYRTDMFTSTSGEIISTIIGTKQGRIFMLSKQGRVWELDYRVSIITHELHRLLD